MICLNIIRHINSIVRQDSGYTYISMYDEITMYAIDSVEVGPKMYNI